MNTSSNEARSLLLQTDVPIKVTHRVRSTGTSALYATKADGTLFGREGGGVVYVNNAKRMDVLDARNVLLAEFDAELRGYNETLKRSTKEMIEEDLADIPGPLQISSRYIFFRMGNGTQFHEGTGY
ncbi:hypothetical protein J2T58_002172 [Methanocalculus alkaliphilus]|nr:hypothetical protein [Methanocalculus alkaliphilus]MCP1716296.1 hypothetical protein [Methanocalculus alkaliphilus]